MPKLSVYLTYVPNAVIKNSTILTRGEQPKIWKTSGVFWYPSAKPRSFARFAQWLIRPWFQRM